MALKVTQCSFCGRVVQTRGHHVVPKSKGGRQIVPTCHSCEDFIHKTWSHKELRDTFNTVEKIRADERYQRFHAWLRKQDATAVHRSKRARDRVTGEGLRWLRWVWGIFAVHVRQTSACRTHA